jgi:pyruvate/2-oxoglutarate dehydrogenase complex dihydrolipoamide acyltransferase (E2) component
LVVDSKKPPPLSKNEAINTCRKYLNEGKVTWSPHLKQRMKERNISIRDVINTVEGGTIVKTPEWKEEYGEYNYFIRGKDIEGTKLTVKVAISEEEEMLTFITVF